MNRELPQSLKKHLRASVNPPIHDINKYIIILSAIKNNLNIIFVRGIHMSDPKKTGQGIVSKDITEEVREPLPNVSKPMAETDSQQEQQTEEETK
ncbi:hypothetical protein SAMN05444955_10527 [Lihuaxuella thermophila]|uniref:Uncharacterized protein n=1 Tax=Lihuaxuella thermophila TaxID=1173111 RepID=A0A1H8D7K5_9BACL|nr:hypothetical protein SAMN05444955_10527 [Lihuaxuella thermophila]